MSAFDMNGNLKWARANFADYYLDYIHLMCDDSGNVFLYGVPDGSLGYNIVVGDSEFIHNGVFFIAKVNPINGEMIRHYQNSNSTYSTETIAACVDHHDNITVTGGIYLPGNIQFGNIDLTEINTSNSFIMYVAQFSDSSFIQPDTTIKTPTLFNIYPNPFTNSFSIQFPNNTNGSVKVYSVDGRLIYKSELFNSKNVINTQAWPNGCYIIDLTYSEGEEKRIKMIKLYN